MRRRSCGSIKLGKGARLFQRKTREPARISEALETWRITLTLPVLNAARQVVFLVSGADKAQKVKEILAAPDQAKSYPAALVLPAAGTLSWLLDQASAAKLEGEA